MPKIKQLLTLAALFLFSVVFATNAFAAGTTNVLVSRYTETYKDGSYAVISIYQDAKQTKRDSISGSKDYQYYNDGLAWTFTVYGSFSYTGNSASCTAATYDTSIVNSAWHLVTGNAWASENSAIASGTMRRNSDGSTIHPNVTLSCSANGDLY